VAPRSGSRRSRSTTASEGSPPRGTPTNGVPTNGATPALRIVHGTAFEALAELAAFTSGPARASLESGKPWIRETRRLAGRELLVRVSAHPLDTYANLATLAADLGDAVTLEAWLAELRAMPPERLRRRLIGADSAMAREPLDDELLEAAAEGDARARTRLHAVLGIGRTMRRSVDRILRIPKAELQRDLVQIVAAWGDRVFPRWGPEAMAAVERDVAATAELAARSSAAEVVASATGGLAVAPAISVRQLVVAPTVALRPFVVPVDVGATAMYLVSVSDEANDPAGGVSNRLVKTAAALGDPIRVRALHELARHDGLTASMLAERLGVERTSLHHHLGLLRSAGLLTIEDPGDGSWHYRVRRDRIDELGSLLRSYLDETPR
jgi:DNA-binding transcriptional ArsR family regulator